MARIKTKRKVIIDPEITITLWSQIQDYVKQNIQQIGAIALIIVVVAGGITIWRLNLAKAERASLSKFYAAMSLFEKKSEKPGETELLLAQALEAFKKISQEHSATKAGVASLCYAGNCSYSLKKFDEAIACYKEFLDKAGSDTKYLRSFAYEGMGYVLEGKGEYNEALQWFEKQKAEEAFNLNSMATLNLARCNEAAGNREKACALYKEYLEKQPSSSFRDLAQIKIENLCKNK